MRTILYATLIVGLTAPAFAQEMNIMGLGGKMKTQDQADREAQGNAEYQKTMKALPDQGVKKDPWGNVRATGGSQTDQKQKKAGAK
jgi:hypothetical protein